MRLDIPGVEVLPRQQHDGTVGGRIAEGRRFVLHALELELSAVCADKGPFKSLVRDLPDEIIGLVQGHLAFKLDYGGPLRLDLVAAEILLAPRARLAAAQDLNAGFAGTRGADQRGQFGCGRIRRPHVNDRLIAAHGQRHHLGAH